MPIEVADLALLACEEGQIDVERVAKRGLKVRFAQHDDACYTRSVVSAVSYQISWTGMMWGGRMLFVTRKLRPPTSYPYVLR